MVLELLVREHELLLLSAARRDADHRDRAVRGDRDRSELLALVQRHDDHAASAGHRTELCSVEDEQATLRDRDYLVPWRLVVGRRGHRRLALVQRHEFPPRTAVREHVAELREEAVSPSRRYEHARVRL